MNIGMLWVDTSKESLLDKIVKAKKYYKEKYGNEPNSCFVNPNAIEKETEMAGLLVIPVRYILPSHLWIGIEES